MSRLPLPDNKPDYDQEYDHEECLTTMPPKLFSTIMHLSPRGITISLDRTDELEIKLKEAINNDAKLTRFFSDEIERKLMEKNLISYESLQYQKPEPDYIDVEFKLRVYPNS
ncbi:MULTISPECIES: hypothetical protein [unclassified Thiocapsa]|uniref:hypothetical protein n=1 Tax=unclassified Thiocapsa TaxID=2641286 RepID=UPI0035B4376C